MIGGLERAFGIPSRVLRDLDAITEVVRSLPEFERTVVAHLEELGEVERDLRADLRDVKSDVARMETELIAARATVAQLRGLVGDAVEHIPGHDEDGDDDRGPLARAKDALTGESS